MNCYLLRVVQRKLRILPPCLQSLGLHEGVSHLLNLPRLRLRLHLLLSRALLLRSLFNPCHFHRSPSRCRLHVRLLVHRRLKLRTILHQMLCHLDPETDHLVHFNKLPPVPSPPERRTVVVAHLIIVVRNRWNVHIDSRSSSHTRDCKEVMVYILERKSGKDGA